MGLPSPPAFPYHSAGAEGGPGGGVRMVAVDGTGDGPPKKTAENWSRKDNIRAGAVSGPWRSAPRAATGTPAPPMPASAPLSPSPERAGPQVQPAAGRETGYGPRPHVARTGQLRGVAIWIGLGAFVAAAIVAAAVLFRPSEQPPEAEQVAPAVDAPADGAADGGSAPVTEPAPAGPARQVADAALLPVRVVRLRIGPEVGETRRDALVSALKGAGVPEVVVEPLPFRIATSRIGYYRDDDLAAAQALARAISPTVGDGSAIGVRDYGELLTDPEPGRLDLWIGG